MIQALRMRKHGGRPRSPGHARNLMGATELGLISGGAHVFVADLERPELDEADAQHPELPTPSQKMSMRGGPERPWSGCHRVAPRGGGAASAESTAIRSAAWPPPLTTRPASRQVTRPSALSASPCARRPTPSTWPDRRRESRWVSLVPPLQRLPQRSNNTDGAQSVAGICIYVLGSNGPGSEKPSIDSTFA